MTDDRKSPWMFIIAVLVLVVVAVTAFVVVSDSTGIIIGRDAGYHAYVFFHQVFPSVSLGDLLADRQGQQRPDYGPAFVLLTTPFRALFGTYPSSFFAVNLFVLMLTFVLFAAMFSRMGVYPGWILIFGLCLIGSRLGTLIYFTYNIDAISTLATLGAFYVMAIDQKAASTRLPQVCAVLLFCVFVRVNTLIYLLVPVLFFALKIKNEGRAAQTTRAATKAFADRYAWTIAGATLFVLCVLYYWPKRAFFSPGNLAANNNFNFHPDAGLTLWTAQNWTWFFDRLSLVYAPALWVALLPLAAYGFWRLLPGRRLSAALFLFAPCLFYSLIIGTRKVEYLAPTFVMVLFFGIAGLAKLSNRPAKWAATAFLLIVSVAQFFFTLNNAAPLAMLSAQQFPNRVILRGLSPAENIAGKFIDRKGSFELAHRLIEVALPNKSGAVAVLSKYDYHKVPAPVVPVLESAPAGTSITELNDPFELSGRRFDLLLYSTDQGEDFLPPEPIGSLYRKALTLDLWQVDRVHVFLPKRPNAP